MGKITDSCNFDVEFGNSIGFYSGSKNGVYTGKSLKNKNPVKLHGVLEKTKVKVDDNLKEESGSSVLRKTTFSFIENSHIFDLVSRFVVPSESKNASINDQNITHCSSNIYHQQVVNDSSVVKIPVKNGILIFRPLKSLRVKGFRQVFYLRDERKEDGNYIWIVHHRVIADEDYAKLILRCCHPSMEGVVPLERIIPRFIKKFFFRIREKKYPNFPFMVVGESMLLRGDTMLLKTRVNLEGV